MEKTMNYPEVTLFFESLEEADLESIVNEADELAEEIYAMGDFDTEESELDEEALEEINGGILDVVSIAAALLRKLRRR